MGVLDSVGNTLLIYTHGNKVAPFMQAMHFSFGVGALLSPLMVRWAMVSQTTRTNYHVHGATMETTLAKLIVNMPIDEVEKAVATVSIY